MIPLKISEIIESTSGVLLRGDTKTEISSVFIDSRKTEKNGIFVPIIGEKFNSHEFVLDVLKKGALASFWQKSEALPEMNAYGAIIEVENTIDALQKLAEHYRKKFTIPIIGITGSAGKTTTKEMVFSALSSNLKVLKTDGNQNGQIGLPLSIFKLSNEYDAAVFEMGISKIGEMQKLCDIADPDFAVITNIGVSHIENFETTRTTLSEKTKIFKKNNGVYFLNGDNLELSEFGNQNDGKEKIYFGINGDYKFKAENVSQSGNETKFVLVSENYREEIKIPCLGMHNVYNALAAIAVAIKLRLSLEDIKSNLLNYKSSNMRQEIFELKGITIIDDSYNASSDSVKAAVDVLKNLNFFGGNIVVLGDMLELGEKSSQLHFELGKYIGYEGIDVLITVGEAMKYLAQGVKSVNRTTEIFCFENRNDAFEKITKIAKEKDKILIKGSRGMKMEEISKMIKEYYKN